MRILQLKRRKLQKTWFYSAVLAGALAVSAVPLMGFSSVSADQTKIIPNQVTLESGGTSVPKEAPIYKGEPMDGIISGTVGCQPDLHQFDNSIPGSHIVFTAGLKEVTTSAQAVNFDNSGAKIYVDIMSNGQTVTELPLELHSMPVNGVLKEVDDPNRGIPFWVVAAHLNGDNAVNLPTGDYNYQFKAKDGKGHVLSVWEPKNHKFTITDGTQTN